MDRQIGVTNLAYYAWLEEFDGVSRAYLKRSNFLEADNKLHALCTTHQDPGVTEPNPHAFRDMANSPAPPSRGCKVRAQGLKSWGVKENST